MSTDTEPAKEVENAEPIQVAPDEYQRMVKGFEHSERVRKKSLEVAKLRAAYNKAKDKSLKAKKALDEAHHELEELGAELDDPQQRLPLEDVDDSKDPKSRKSPERRPQDHDDDADDAEEQEPQNSNDDDDYEDVEDDDVETDPEPAEETAMTLEDVLKLPVKELGEGQSLSLELQPALVQSLEINKINTIGDACVLVDNVVKDKVDLPHWGPGKSKKLIAVIKTIRDTYPTSEADDVPSDPEPDSKEPAASNDEPVDSGDSEPQEPELKSDAEPKDAESSSLVTVRIKSPSESLIEQGLVEGKIVEGKRTGKAVVVMASENSPVTLIPQFFDIVA